MASNKPLLPAQYPIYWRQAMDWLGARPQGEIDITLETRYNPRTLHSRAMGMRQSISMYWDWSDGAKQMVARKELHFQWRGDRLWAIRRPGTRPIGEVLRDATNSLRDCY